MLAYCWELRPQESPPSLSIFNPRRRTRFKRTTTTPESKLALPTLADRKTVGVTTQVTSYPHGQRPKTLKFVLAWLARLKLPFFTMDHNSR